MAHLYHDQEAKDKPFGPEWLKIKEQVERGEFNFSYNGWDIVFSMGIKWVGISHNWMSPRGHDEINMECLVATATRHTDGLVGNTTGFTPNVVINRIKESIDDPRWVRCAIEAAECPF